MTSTRKGNKKLAIYDLKITMKWEAQAEEDTEQVRRHFLNSSSCWASAPDSWQPHSRSTLGHCALEWSFYISEAFVAAKLLAALAAHLSTDSTCSTQNCTAPNQEWFVLSS
jgi:hypothetical protein